MTASTDQNEGRACAATVALVNMVQGGRLLTVDVLVRLEMTVRIVEVFLGVPLRVRNLGEHACAYLQRQAQSAHQVMISP